MHRVTKHSRPKRNDEEGAILVVWVVALTAIMGLVAMAIDLGNIGQTKQHARNAAEAAVLAGVVDLAPLGPGGGGVVGTQETAAVNDAETYLLDNYPLQSPNWNSCAPFPDGVAAYAGADCFGFFTGGGSSNPNGLAVQVPPQSVSATFGKADGFSGASVSSSAYASIQTAQSSYVLPFAYSVNGAGPGLECLETGSGKKAAQCTGFTTGSGKFGMIDSPRYVIFPGWSTAKANNAPIETDVVLGLDHPLNVYQSGNEVCDAVHWPGCTYYNNAAPYTAANFVAPATGQATSDLNGLFEPITSPDGTCTFAPRLDHPDGFIATSSCAADQGSSSGTPPNTDLSVPLLTTDTFGSSYNLNGQNISAFLNQTGSAFTSNCTLPANAATTAIDAKQGSAYVWSSYDNCLSADMANYNPTTDGPIFSSKIEGSPRFGLVPLVDSSNGTNAEQITGFDDVYLDLMFGQHGISSILAWVFPPSAVTSQPTSGQGLGGYYGGSYVANLCSYGTNC